MGRWAFYSRLLYVALVVGIACTPAVAQTTREKWVLVTTGPAAVMLEASPASKVIGTVEAGTKLRVYDAKNDWYWVVLPKGENEPAARWGWILAAMVVPTNAPAPAPQNTPAAAPQPPAAQPEATAQSTAKAATRIGPAPPPPAPAAVTPPSAPSAPPAFSAPVSHHRVFIGVNGGYQSSSFDFAGSGSAPLYAETRTWTAHYQVRSAPAFDVEAGVRIWRQLLAGIGVSRFETTKRVATIAGEVPSPFFFDRLRSISGESQGLEHIEQTVHVSAMWTMPVGRHLLVTAFGGPSFFFLRRQMVEDVEYTDGYPFLTAQFRTADLSTLEQTKAGFQAGADVSWFFTDTIGVGGIARFTRARTTLEGAPVDLGGFQAGGGVRVRLGR